MTSKTSVQLKTVEALRAIETSALEKPVEARSPISSTDYMFHVLEVISRLRDASLDQRLHPLRLNAARYRALATVEAFGPCRMSTYAGFSPLDRSTTTRIVDQLVTAGWVSRTKATGDRRQIYIALTAAGAAICEEARAIVSTHNAMLIEGINDETKSQVIAAALMLAAKLEPRSGQFVDRQSETESSFARAEIVS